MNITEQQIQELEQLDKYSSFIDYGLALYQVNKMIDLFSEFNVSELQLKSVYYHIRMNNYVRQKKREHKEIDTSGKNNAEKADLEFKELEKTIVFVLKVLKNSSPNSREFKTAEANYKVLLNRLEKLEYKYLIISKDFELEIKNLERDSNILEPIDTKIKLIEKQIGRQTRNSWILGFEYSILKIFFVILVLVINYFLTTSDPALKQFINNYIIDNYQTSIYLSVFFVQIIIVEFIISKIRRNRTKNLFLKSRKFLREIFNRFQNIEIEFNELFNSNPILSNGLRVGADL